MTISEDKLCTLATWVKTPTPSPSLPALRKLKTVMDYWEKQLRSNGFRKGSVERLASQSWEAQHGHTTSLSKGLKAKFKLHRSLVYTAHILN